MFSLCLPPGRARTYVCVCVCVLVHVCACSSPFLAVCTLVSLMCTEPRKKKRSSSRLSDGQKSQQGKRGAIADGPAQRCGAPVKAAYIENENASLTTRRRFVFVCLSHSIFLVPFALLFLSVCGQQYDRVHHLPPGLLPLLFSSCVLVDSSATRSQALRDPGNRPFTARAPIRLCNYGRRLRFLFFLWSLLLFFCFSLA